MAHQDVMNVTVLQGVVGWQDCATRIAEDVLYALALDAFPKNLRSRFFHSQSSVPSSRPVGRFHILISYSARSYSPQIVFLLAFVAVTVGGVGLFPGSGGLGRRRMHVTMTHVTMTHVAMIYVTTTDGSHPGIGCLCRAIRNGRGSAGYIPNQLQQVAVLNRLDLVRQGHKTAIDLVELGPVKGKAQFFVAHPQGIPPRMLAQD